jgi:hypothetical protein
MAGANNAGDVTNDSPNVVNDGKAQGDQARTKMADDQHNTPRDQQLNAVKQMQGGENKTKTDLPAMSVYDSAPGGNKPKDASEQIKPVTAEQMTADERRTYSLQQLILLRAANRVLSVNGLDEDAFKELLKAVQKEMLGQDSPEHPGHPHFGHATMRLFGAYKERLEQDVKATEQEIAKRGLGLPVNSPEQLSTVFQYGRQLPEQPLDFLARVRSGDGSFKLQTSENGKSKDVATDRPPSQDVIDSILAAERFKKWGEDSVLFDSKLKLQEQRLTERIQESWRAGQEGWPKEWLDLPQRQTDRAGWCSAVMQHMNECTQMARTIEALVYLQNNEGMSDFAKKALANLPRHIKVDVEYSDPPANTKVSGVKHIHFDHPKDLDLSNPDYQAQQRADQQWIQDYGKSIMQALNEQKLAHSDKSHFLYWGDIQRPGQAAVVDKKTNEVTEIYATDKGPSKPLDDNHISQPVNLTRCRFDVGTERGANDEVKTITVDYSMQNGQVPPYGYQNLYMHEVGKAEHPTNFDNRDGKLRFKPEDWVVARDDHGREVIMQARDLQSYKEDQEFSYWTEKTVNAVMDASMLVGGVGAIGGGLKVMRGANAAMELLEATEQGMQAARIGAAALERAGTKQIFKGIWEVGIGGTGLFNSAWGDENVPAVNQARGYYFLGQAFLGLPGISRATGAIGDLLGLGKDAKNLATVESLIKEAKVADPLSAGPVLSAIQHSGDFGMKWSGRAFFYIMGKQLAEQKKEIDNIGQVDGLDFARQAMAGVDQSEKSASSASKREQQKMFLASADKIVDDFCKTHDVSKNSEQVKQILDKTKELLAPAPDTLSVDELRKFQAQRQKDVDEFKTHLLTNLLFDPARISEAERERADKVNFSDSKALQNLRDARVIVESTTLEQSKLTEAQADLEKKKLESHKPGLNPEDLQKAQREEGLAKLRVELAKKEFDDAQERARVALRKLETDDASLTDPSGRVSEKKFAGKSDVQDASALAYLLLSVDRKSMKLPDDGVLFSQKLTVPGWSVSKTVYDPSAGEGAPPSSHTETVAQPEREILQQLKVSDLAARFLPDLKSEQPADKRMNTAEALDRLGVISSDTHASTLKGILLDPSTPPESKNRAIANLGAVITNMEVEESARALHQSVSDRFEQSSRHFSNTSSDLKGVLEKIATNAGEDKNVRAMASYVNYTLNRDRSTFDQNDQTQLEKVMTGKNGVPGISFDDYISYMKAQAGLQNPENSTDKASSDRRMRAALALEQMIDNADSGKDGYKRIDIDRAIARSLDPAHPDVRVIDKLLAPVQQADGTQRTRLQELDHADEESRRLAMQVRTQVCALLETPMQAGKNGSYPRADVQLRTGLIERLEPLMRSDIGSSAEMDQIRQRMVLALTASLESGTSQEVAALRAQLLIANAKQDGMPESEKGSQEASIKALQERLRQVEGEVKNIQGVGLQSLRADDSINDLAKKITEATRAGKNTADLERELTDAYGNRRLLGTRVEGKSDYSSLNDAACQDSGLRAAAASALGALGVANNSDAVRALKERATSPKDENDTNPRTEPDASVRVAAITALGDKHAMSPLDFAQFAAGLIANEKSPALATVLRNAARYGDLGLDPTSLHYQDIKAESKVWEGIQIDDADTAYKRSFGENQPFNWLDGAKLRDRLNAAQRAVYPEGVGGWWDYNQDGGKWVHVDNSDGNLYDSWLPRVKERKALSDALQREFYDRIKTELVAPAISMDNDAQSQQSRAKAQEACFALVCGKFDSYSGYASNGRTDASIQLTQTMVHHAQVEAARALAKSCEAGMPDRAHAGKYIYEALKKVNDPVVRTTLLKGLDNLSSTNHGDGKEEGKRDIVFAPDTGVDQVLNSFVEAVGHNDQSQTAVDFQLSCIRFLREHATTKDMNKLNILATLEGSAELPQTKPEVKNAIWDLIADRRERVFPAYTIAPKDQASQNPSDRTALLVQAKEEQKNEPTGKKGIDQESWVQNSVYKIFESTKGLPVTLADDPRVPLLIELSQPQNEQGEKNDERVRLAAAICLRQGNVDVDTMNFAVGTIASLSVEATMPGVRQDAARMLDALKGADLQMAEGACKAVLENAKQSYNQDGSASNALKLADSYNNYARVMVKEGRDTEAEKSFQMALNLYRDPSAPALQFADLAKMNYIDVAKGLEKYGADPSRHLREVADCMFGLAAIHAKADKSDKAQFALAEQLASSALQMRSLITADEKYRLSNLVDRGAVSEMRDDAGFAFCDYQYALQEMSKCKDRNPDLIISCLDRLADLTSKGHFTYLIDGQDHNQDGWLYERKYASAAIEWKQYHHYPNQSLAKSYDQRAEALEALSRSDAEHKAEYLQKSERDLQEALKLVQKDGKNAAQAQAAQLKLLADFYHRNGDPSKGADFQRQSEQLLASSRGRGGLVGMSDADMQKQLADCIKQNGEKDAKTLALRHDMMLSYSRSGMQGKAIEQASASIGPLRELLDKQVSDSSVSAGDVSLTRTALRDALAFQASECIRSGKCADALPLVSELIAQDRILSPKTLSPAALGQCQYLAERLQESSTGLERVVIPAESRDAARLLLALMNARLQDYGQMQAQNPSDTKVAQSRLAQARTISHLSESLGRAYLRDGQTDECQKLMQATTTALSQAAPEVDRRALLYQMIRACSANHKPEGIAMAQKEFDALLCQGKASDAVDVIWVSYQALDDAGDIAGATELIVKMSQATRSKAGESDNSAYRNLRRLIKRQESTVKAREDASRAAAELQALDAQLVALPQATPVAR